MSDNPLVPFQSKTIVSARSDQVVPAIVGAAGGKSSRRFLEFFAVTIENPNTRAAYFHACRRFFAWCEQKGVDEFVAIEPMHVAAYIRALGKDFEKSTVKQHLAAIRMLFDWLVFGQVVAINPAHSVRGPKHAVKRGKTPVLTPDEARKASRQHRGHDPGGPARSSADRPHGLQLRARKRGRRHAC
jgi:site-specific recombinase XerD